MNYMYICGGYVMDEKNCQDAIDCGIFTIHTTVKLYGSINGV